MNRWIVIISIFFIFLFTLKGMVVIDPDFGWHLRTGFIILSNGSPPTSDPFSYTMSNYPYIDHSWLMSLITALLYPHIGMGGLSLIFSLVCVGAFILQYVSMKNKNISPFFLGLFVCLSFVGVRSQMSTLFFFSLILLLLRSNKHIQLLIIPLMALWVNLHGGFVLGLLTLILYGVLEGVRTKKIPTFYIFLITVCIGLTVFNPYGAHLWREVFLTSSDLLMHLSIREWMPAPSFIHAPFWIYAGFIIALTIRYKNMQRDLFQIILSLTVFISAFFSMRHIPVWLITTFYLWGQYFVKFEKDANRTNISQQRYSFVKKIASSIVLIACVIQSILFIYSISSATEEAMYPKKALTYLTTQQKKGNLFAYYGWGGYILWKNPQEKTFIDGRMAIWKWVNNDPRFLSYAYRDYLNIMGKRVPFEYFRKKYHITHVLIPAQKKPDKNINPFSSYPIEYSDNTAILYNTDIESFPQVN